MFKLYDYNNIIDFSNIELTAKEAILAKCYSCCCFDGVEVKECNIKTCSLYKFKEKWFKIPRKPSDNDKRKYNTFKKLDF